MLNYHRALTHWKLSEECGGTLYCIPVCAGRCPAPRRCERPRPRPPPPLAHSPPYSRMTLKIWRKSFANPGCLCRIRLFPSRIPDSELTRSRICIKSLGIFNPKNWYQVRQKKIGIFSIPDPEVKKTPDPGSATLITIEINVRSEQRIRTGFKADPDQSFYLNTYTDPGSQIMQIWILFKPCCHKKLNFYMKYIVHI